MKKIFFAFVLILLPQWALAQATPFYMEDNINNQIKVKIYVVGDASAKTQIQEALYASVDHAKAVAAKLNANDPTSELGAINQKKTKGEYMVSEELAKAVEIGLAVSNWTHGFFDITFDSIIPNHKKIGINRKNNALKIKDYNMVIDLRYMLKGFLADQIAEDLNNAGWKNCFVKVGNEYVARGNDVNEPWKIPVVTPNSKLAKRVLLYKASDVGSGTSTYNDSIVDPKTKSAATSDLQSVTVFTQTAAKAEGLATAVYVMGSVEGKKFLEKNKNLRAVFADSEGKFTPIPETNPAP
ncbi:MAG: FAD:protein FMN transferase [Deltaproteobacteria bacterium]|nr:FAD:protein FMN transferase [Deltaproteobacteria bacterium]